MHLTSIWSSVGSGTSKLSTTLTGAPTFSTIAPFILVDLLKIGEYDEHSDVFMLMVVLIPGLHSDESAIVSGVWL